MRSIQRVAAIAGAILAAAVLALPVSASSPSHPLHATKDCSTFTGVAPSPCTIAASNVGAIPVGAKVWYTGPVLTNSYFLSSNVELDAGHGNSANGYCIFEARTSTGMCTFWEGTGRLAGFHAIAHVTIDAVGLFHWDGTYYLEEIAHLRCRYCMQPR